VDLLAIWGSKHAGTKHTARRIASHREPSRIWLAALCLFAGLTAVWGGLELVLSPDGSFMRLPLSLLENTPFRDFVIPGLLLTSFVGGINTLAGVLLLRGHPRADAEAMVSGAILATWILVEVILIRHVHWLHGLYLAVGLTIFGIAVVREKRAGKLANTTRTLARVLAHSFVGWALSAMTMEALLATTSLRTALLGRALAAPGILVFVSRSYFAGQHAWGPLRAAIIFATLFGLLDLVILASFVHHSLAMYQGFVGGWLPLFLVFGATWMTGTNTLIQIKNLRRGV
jgi:hypothetical protein